MELVIHGGAQEVGRSCVELITEKYTRILFDAGLKMAEHGSEFPESVTNLSEIDAVLLSHAHLDHCGALPYFDHNGLECPIYATGATKALTKLILEDAFKVGQLTHQELGYFQDDVRAAIACMSNMKSRQKGIVNEVRFSLHSINHIPGAAAILVEAEGKRILYTGDIKMDETQLQPATDLGSAQENIHTLICESTYGDREHPDRKKTEKEFINEIKTTIARGGSVLIPVFAIGRAQEILLVIGNAYDQGLIPANVPYYLDGMAAAATKITIEYPESIKQSARLAQCFRRAQKITNPRERIAAVRKQGIFITTSGMLTGGPIIEYLKCLNNSRNALLLTGYQGEHTNGRLLEEEGMVFIDGWKTRVHCSWKKFDFSAHAGLSELKRLIRTIHPKQVAFVHGDPAAIKNIAVWASAMDITTHAPNMCDKIHIPLGG
ncbi:MAG: MBL fold metallo-hydrolase [Candidatus Woesearchaeota archaeon]|nr:MBL fold metallo-hydrolase [Candidatus Woesearchaeota archaeon]